MDFYDNRLVSNIIIVTLVVMGIIGIAGIIIKKFNYKQALWLVLGVIAFVLGVIMIVLGILNALDVHVVPSRFRFTTTVFNITGAGLVACWSLHSSSNFDVGFRVAYRIAFIAFMLLAVTAIFMENAMIILFLPVSVVILGILSVLSIFFEKESLQELEKPEEKEE